MSLPVLRLGQTEIRVHITFIAAGAVLVSAGYALHLVLFAGSLLFHEMGHLMGALWMGASVTKVEVWPFGAAARLEQPWQLSPASETVVALMGPLNSGVLGSLACLVSAALARTQGVSFPLLTSLVDFNMGLFALNLVPCLPLDGGRILRARMALRFGYKEATRKVTLLGLWVGVLATACSVLCVFFGKTWLTGLLFGPLLFWGAREERQAAVASDVLRMLERQDGLRRRKVVPVEEILVSADATVSQVVDSFKPSRYHVILVAERNMRVLGRLPEIAILEAYYEGHTGRLMREFCDSFL